MTGVLVSGVGVLSPNGVTTDAFWSSLVVPQNVLAEASTFPGSGILVGELPAGDQFKGLPRVTPTFCDRSAMMAVAAAKMALEDAGLASGDVDPDRVAVILGNGAGGQASLEEQYAGFYLKNQPRPSPLSVAKFMPSSIASWVSMAMNFQGPAFVVNSACASATHAIGVAAQMIRAGIVDVVVTGGVEACLTNGVLRAWASMGILAPDACRPFARNRRGLILSEGAGVLILESERSCRARGAQPAVALAGYGCSADAGELTNPNVDGMAKAMVGAIRSSGLDPSRIDYVNAHGTGTRANDRTETVALRTVFEAGVPPTSSTKGVHGHALGAAGGLEAVATVLAMRNGVAPPTANYDEPDPECDLDVIPNVAREMPIRAALSNSFAFGGLNASLVFAASPGS